MQICEQEACKWKCVCDPLNEHVSVCVSAKVWIDVNPTGRCSMTVQSSAQVSSRSC